MSLAGSQRQTVLALLARLQPHFHTDRALPARIEQLLKRDRRFGSRDRRLYRELIFTAVRYLPFIEPLLAMHPEEAVRRLAWAAADLPATRSFRAALATGERWHVDPAELLPAWFREHCPAAFSPTEAAALATRAPLWLRLQTDAAEPVFSEFAARGWTLDRPPILPTAIRMAGDVDVTKTHAYVHGLVEVQDLGSQLLLESIGITPGDCWLDACAGAGGKTLQLARLLGNSGRVDAMDIRPAALEELAIRAARARLPNVRRVALPESTYDGVLVDAPCSGTGTWRRAPHLKWTTQPADLERARQTQLALLRTHGPRVRRGGRLVYATCSLSRRENEEVIAEFLATAPEFTPTAFAHTFGATAAPDGLGLTFLPSAHDTDGFFVASLHRA